MNFTPITNLLAPPDFSNFQFGTETENGLVRRTVRFRRQNGDQIYQVDFRSRPGGIKEKPDWALSDGFLDEAITFVLILEMYTKRYPTHNLRLIPDSQIKRQLFATLFGRFIYLLETFFTIQCENPSCENPLGYIFLIRRKPMPYRFAPKSDADMRCVSQILKCHFNIKFNKSVRIDYATSTSKSNVDTNVPV